MRKARAVFHLELYASDMHAALGRLLDQTRVAGLQLAALHASAEAGNYRIRASIDVRDREVVEKLARRIGSMVCIAAINVTGEGFRATPALCTASP